MSITLSMIREAFSLLLHGTQKQGSAGSEAIKKMNKEKIKYSYSKK